MAMHRDPDTAFNQVVRQAKIRVRSSGNGQRILNGRGAELATIKKGHDGKLWYRITARGAQLRNYLLTHKG